ncbi:TraB/GumN family protein [Sphingomonas arenae]|uniref:TraB/GumN family protein n=1 Tax=Sphingomonas arenae TaxID=2812555 RepID=UPI00196769A4
MKRLWRASAALLVLTAPAAAGAHDAASPAGLTEECANPALWVVRDSDTTVYLFGTFHAHDGKAHWFDHAVRQAFDGSDELVLETLVPESPAAIDAALARHRARKLVAASPALPAAQPSAGLAGTRQAMTAAKSVGLSVEQGADAVLHRAATAAGKPVLGLESFEFQLAMYDRLPGAAASPARAKPKASPAVIAGQMKQMVGAWNAGDHRTFEGVVSAVQAQSPEAYRILFADRNAAWSEWVTARMKLPGTVFVAVGTGHLVGKDSLQALLAAKGLTSARVH